uniref:Uncharacterized protein n=1 Tax=Clastoptera arizonana TaxID=38151 RepID=A0A1B6EDV1_9HEMI
MAALNELNGFKPSWLKWHILVAVGTPIVIGIGYWYVLKRNKQIGSKDTKKEEKIKENTIHRPTVEKDFSTEVKVSSPLERAQELKNSGNKLYLAKMYDDAIRCYTEAIEMCPKEEKDTLSTYYQNRAAAYEQKNILEDVIKDCTSALEYNPRYTKALQRRAKAAERNGNLEQSLQDVTAVCILENFTNNSSLITADKILKQLGRQHAKEQMLKQKLVTPSKHFVKSYLSSFSNNPLLPLNKSHINGHVNTEIPLRYEIKLLILGC